MKKISLSCILECAGVPGVHCNDLGLLFSVSEIEDAGPDDLVYAVSEKYVRRVFSSRCGFAIVPEGDWGLSIPHVCVKNPYFIFAKVLKEMDDYSPSVQEQSPGAFVHEKSVICTGVRIYPGAFVDEDVYIAQGCILYPGVCILKGARIGENCILYPNSVVRENCVLEDGVILQPGAVVGSDGYGFVYQDGAHHKIPQLGNVVLQKDVEVGASTAIDRATFGSTVIGAGTKLDNLVQIGHNVTMGKGCLMASQSGISGSTKVGDFVTFGGQSGSVGHIEIGSGTIIYARGVPTADVAKGSRIAGFPGQDHGVEMKLQASLRRVPEMRKRLLEIARKLDLNEK